ncbi:MAG: MoaD/ThiS family protein [Campylobacteraceae bacterium]|nr:MoaD/ThiS family protein [Campylobacteraceae bacterium]
MSNRMKVTIKLFAQYREGKFKVDKRSYENNSTIENVLDDIGLDLGKYPIGVLMVNGRHVEKDFVLEDEQILAIFPKVGGG